MTTPNKPNKKLTIISLLTLVAILLVFFLFFYLPRNTADEAAKPLESALTTRGATKLCSGGDPGHGPDNLTPWYFAFFTVDSDKEGVVNLIQEAAKHGGYNSLSASGNNTQGDIFYEDKVSKSAMELTFTAFNKGDWNGASGAFCGIDSSKQLPEGKIIFSLGTRVKR